MIAPTWILAVATAILALSGPVALFAWLSARRQDRERRQREHEDAERDRILNDARVEFFTKSEAEGKASENYAAVAAVLAAAVAVWIGKSWK